MSTMVTTPVRNDKATGSEMSNESPLPTPPQAMHDLIRNGRISTARTSQYAANASSTTEQEALSILNDVGNHQSHRFTSYPPNLTDLQSTTQTKVPLHQSTVSSSSGSSSSSSAAVNNNNNNSTNSKARRAADSSSPALRSDVSTRTSEPGKASPGGTLAASLGTSLSHRQALSSQMGIHNGSMGNGDEDQAAGAAGEPSALHTSSLLNKGQRASSYESAIEHGAPIKLDRSSAAGSGLRADRVAASKSSGPFAALSAKDKENLENYRGEDRGSIRSPAKGEMEEHAPTSSFLRKSLSRSNQSPSPTANDKMSRSAFARSTARRISAEETSAPSQTGTTSNNNDLVRRSSDEGGAVIAKQAQISRTDEGYKEDQQQPRQRESSYNTPLLHSGSRVLRSGQQPTRHTAAPWSVGRSIKRIDRHTGLDKPPQRVVAQIEEQEDDEDDEHEHVRNDNAAMHNNRRPSPVAEERSKSTRSGRQSSEENSGASGERAANKPSLRDANSREKLRRHSGDDGDIGQDDRLHVPLGADEDDEEDEVIPDNVRASHPFARQDLQLRTAARHAGNPISSTFASDMQAKRRRMAFNDVMSAKVSADAGPRRVLAQTTESSVAPKSSTAASATTSIADVNVAAHGLSRSATDFMSLVRKEAERQSVRQGFLEQLGTKPSKDLETKFNGYKFKKVRKAGEGGFSTVWIVRGPFAAPDPYAPGAYVDVPEAEQAYFAMKQVTLKKMEQVSREEVLEECNLLQTLASKRDNEDFILRFFGWKSSTGSLKILLELGEHDFNRVLRAQRLSHEEIVTYWYQMVQAVQFTHEQGNIVHTDLKPANFLVADGRLKLIDFGIAQKIPVGTIHIKRDAMIGTPNYMAPETVRAVKEGRKQVTGVAAASQQNGSAASSRVYKAGKASDVWALGCILYQMVYSRPPFEQFHGDDKLREILNPNHTIDFTPVRFGPAPPSRHGEGYGEHDNADGQRNEDDADDEQHIEQIDERLVDAMRLTLTYDAVERITIPQLLEHPLLRPLEEQRLRAAAAGLRRGDHGADDEDNADQNEEDDDDDATVPMSRSTLRDVLHKIYAFARNGELHEHNLDARADQLFENLRMARQQQQQQ